MKKVFITRRLPNIAVRMLQEHFHVDVNPENKTLPREKLIESMKQYDGILTMFPDKVDQEVLSYAQQLKVIVNFAVGFDNIDSSYAESLGIKVYNCPAAGTNSTADATFALFLSLLRHISASQRFVLDNKWEGWDPENFLGEELAGKTFGIVGYGRIGQAVARRALGFDLKVVVYDEASVPIQDPRIEHASWEALLECADYLSLHIPMSKKNHHLINYETIKKMKKRPVIINMARGPVINSDDLARALQQKLLRGAALDVTDPEPIDGNHPLCHLDNCLVTPHIGGSTLECRQSMAKSVAQTLIDALI